MSDIENKRTGYARKKARVILEKYFKDNPPVVIPIPIEKISSYYDFEIYELNNLDPNHRGMMNIVKEENRKLIGINKNYYKTAKRFSIGHELGHYFLDHPAEDECTDEENIIYNREAEEFAAELIMPFDLIKAVLNEFKGDLKGFAKALDVSEQALYIKLQNQKLLNKFLGI